MGKRANRAVGLALAVVAVVAVVFMIAPPADGPGMRALVHDGDGAVLELPLDRDSETTVTTSLGTNVVVVEAGSVYVRDADCDNHDCIRQGRIDSPGQQIICLPHKLWIEIAGNGGPAGEMDPDAVAVGGDFDVTTR